MKPAKVKFLIGSSIIVVILIALAATGFQESKTYYLHVDEVYEKGSDIYGMQLKVLGKVVEGSVKRDSRPVTFTIELNDKTLPVQYVGDAPIPDTFKDGSEVVVEGKMKRNGVFESDFIQAKCASKYEATDLE